MTREDDEATSGGARGATYLTCRCGCVRWNQFAEIEVKGSEIVRLTVDRCADCGRSAFEEFARVNSARTRGAGAS